MADEHLFTAEVAGPVRGRKVEPLAILPDGCLIVFVILL